VAIAFLGIFSMPLRAILRTCGEPKGASSFCELPNRIVCFAFYTILWLGFAIVYLAGVNMDPLAQGIAAGAAEGTWGEYMATIVVQTPYMFSHLLGFPALVSLHVLLRRRPDSKLPFLMMAYIYVPAIAFPMLFELVPRLGLIYLLGLLHQAMNLTFYRRLHVCFQSYWLFMLVPLLLLSMPALVGRCDLYPALTVWERFRWLFTEATLMAFILSRVYEASDPYGLCAILGWWALFAYVTHVMFARLVPTPYGAIIEFGFVPLFISFGKWQEGTLTLDCLSAAGRQVVSGGWWTDPAPWGTEPLRANEQEAGLRAGEAGLKGGGASSDAYGTFGSRDGSSASAQAVVIKAAAE